LSVTGELRLEFSVLSVSQEKLMHATVRRYEGVDQTRTDELAKRVGETLTPRLSRLPGFGGYYLIEAGNGVFTSIGLFDTAAQAEQSTRVAADWVREEKLDAVLPNPPKITAGRVIAQKTNGTAAI
jgi:hypothetical protein